MSTTYKYYNLVRTMYCHTKVYIGETVTEISIPPLLDVVPR